MYKMLTPHEITGEPIPMVKRLADTAFIPFDPANTDYQQFKLDLADGVELQNADGNVMSDSEVEAFIATLPA
jgi:hypothetical protein